MTFETIKKILLDLGIDEERIHADAYLHKDLELDSTETVQIALDLKRLYGVTVKFESRQDLTVADVCALIDQAKDTVLNQ
jgi:acyl carrier protein